MLVVFNINDLEKHELEIKKLLKNSSYFEFKFENLMSIYKSFSEAISFFDFDKKLFIALKRKNEDVFESIIQSESIYFENENYVCEFLSEIKKYLNCKVLYFPLVYENSLFYKKLSENKNFIIYKRLHTSLVNPNNVSCNLDNLYFSKYYKNKFEKTFKIEVLSNVDAKHILADIELNSWKHVYGQDLVSKPQSLEYYNQLIKSGLAKLVLAKRILDGKYVAYRLDVELEGVIYQLKTSFMQEFNKFKPGVYLLLYDLIEPNRNKHVIIDLFGGPNTLKQIIETQKIDRYDFCFGDDNVILKLRENRENWDKKNYKNFLENKGIKKIFEERK